MARSKTALVLAVSLVSLVGGVVPATGSELERVPIDRAEECSLQDEFTSFRVGVSGVTDDGSQLTLDVLVLLDGVTRREAATALAKVPDYYAPLDIEVVFTYKNLPALDGDDVIDEELIQLSKDAVGGERPEGIDVVYTLTSKELRSAFTGSATAGRADCIGGIKYPHRAFAVGEYDEEPAEIPGVPLTFFESATAKIAAHEIGHLLGGAHEYANCAEGSDLELTRDAFGACTIMFNDVGMIGVRFSTLEGGVVRGYAADYVTD